MPNLSTGDVARQPNPDLAMRLMEEGLISLPQAAAILPPVRGKQVSVSAVFRWCIHGKKGVKLEFIRLHGTHLWTSRAALARFAAELTARSRTVSFRIGGALASLASLAGVMGA